MKTTLNWKTNLKQLFAPPKEEIYNYAPCVVQTDEETKYVFYCTNKESGVIVDYIGWRKGKLEASIWNWGEEQIILSPGDAGWDKIHVCDPDVLQGEFRYKGHLYTWALFYLGCDLLDCNHNQIGVAFADSIEGPWVKFDDNPVISGDLKHWGTGQCTEVSIDNKGKFRLIYRDADDSGTYYKITDCDFSDMTQYRVGVPTRLPRNGLPNTSLCMSHVAYDAKSDTLYLLAEMGWDPVVRCLQEVIIASIDLKEAYTEEGTWNILGSINSDLTSKYGNHNAAILRDAYGRLIHSDELAIYTSSATQTYIWSFRIEEIIANIVSDFP